MGYFASCAVEIVARSHFGAPLLRCYSKKRREDLLQRFPLIVDVAGHPEVLAPCCAIALITRLAEQPGEPLGVRFDQSIEFLRR